MFGTEETTSDHSLVPGALVRLETRTSEFKVGQLLIVVRIDSDGTFIGRDPDSGKESSWINCRHAEVVHTIGWEFLVSALTPRGRKLLEAFDGHRQLALKPMIADALVRTVPDLATAVAEAHQELEAGTAAPPGGARRSAAKRPPRGRPPPPRPDASEHPPRRPKTPPLAEPELDLPALSFGTLTVVGGSDTARSEGEDHE